MLAELSAAGKLPPVAERLPKKPAVVKLLVEQGQYGGTLRYGFVSEVPGWGGLSLLMRTGA